MTRSRIEIETSTGKRTVDARMIGETLAVHVTVGAINAPPFTLTHVPSGHGIARTEREKDAVKIADQLAALNLNGTWSSSDPFQAGAAIPADVVAWLKLCWEARAFVPPRSTAAQPQEEKRMPKPKTFKAAPIANRIVRNLVQSMTPENRKAFHEGLRVATKDQIADALEESFQAGAGGCVFSKE